MEGPGQASVSPPRPPRKARPTRVGLVTSSKRDKTIRVECSYNVRHPKYGKYQKRRTVLHAHDEKNEARAGDVVEISACRPVSKTKHWRLLRVLVVGPREAQGAQS